MRLFSYAFLALLLSASSASAAPFSYATGGCATGGCAGNESWEYTNANEIDTYLDGIDTRVTSAESSINALPTTYLALSGGTMTGTLDFGSTTATMSSGGTFVVGPGAIIGPVSTGIIRATAMSASGQIDDNDLASGAVDGGTAGEIEDNTITAADIATGGVASDEILDDSVTLTTDTNGNYVATVTGDSEITVSGSGTEGRAVTLAIASTITRNTDLAGKSTTSSTLNAIPKFSNTTGDVQDSGVAIDSSNNVSTPGSLTAGGSTGASTFTMRNTVDSGWVECGVVGTTMTCATDADGTPDGTL